MNQTRSRHRAPNFSVAQIADLAKAIGTLAVAAPPIACRLHPDDWDYVRAQLPDHLPAVPSEAAPVSLFVDTGLGLPAGRLAEIRILLDVDAPRLPRKGGSA